MYTQVVFWSVTSSVVHLALLVHMLVAVILGLNIWDISIYVSKVSWLLAGRYGDYNVFSCTLSLLMLSLGSPASQKASHSM